VILSCSGQSSILTANDQSLTPRRRNSDHPIVQMSPEHQQVTHDIGSFNNNFSNFVTGLDDEGRQILQWLSPLEPQKRHQDVRAKRFEGVGNWVLETSNFRKWRDAEDGSVDQVLFCHGGPGVGKTYVR